MQITYTVRHMLDYQVLARKYRPKTFQEVIGQDSIVQTLKNAIKKNCTAHAYLFCGSRGTGKTTLARILSKALNCSNLTENIEPCNSCSSCQQITSGSSLDVLEIDGASNRGIDDIKTLSESAGYCPAHGRWKIYIIDEVHMLTKEAFNALLKTLEEPPSNVKFFFATTEAHKIPATILSRCQRFNLKRLPLQAIITKLQHIASDMSIQVDEASLARIATFAEGGLRDAESLFDQIIAFSDGTVTQETVQEALGLIPYELFFEIDEAVSQSNIQVAFRVAQQLFEQGKDLQHFLEDLHLHFKSILLTKLNNQELLSSIDPSRKESLKNRAPLYTSEQCLSILEMISEAQGSIKTSISQQIALESLLIKIIRIKLRVPIEFLTKRLIELEQKLSAAQKVETKAVEIKEPAPAVEPIKPAPKPTPPPPRVIESPVEAPPIPVIDPNDPNQELRKKARYDTLVQFAAVELDATVQRKQPPDTKRK